LKKNFYFFLPTKDKTETKSSITNKFELLKNELNLSLNAVETELKFLEGLLKDQVFDRNYSNFHQLDIWFNTESDAGQTLNFNLENLFSAYYQHKTEAEQKEMMKNIESSIVEAIKPNILVLNYHNVDVEQMFANFKFLRRVLVNQCLVKASSYRDAMDLNSGDISRGCKLWAAKQSIVRDNSKHSITQNAAIIFEAELIHNVWK